MMMASLKSEMEDLFRRAILCGPDAEDYVHKAYAATAMRLVSASYAKGLEDAAKGIDDLARIWRDGPNQDPSIDSAYRNAAAAIRSRIKAQGNA